MKLIFICTGLLIVLIIVELAGGRKKKKELESRAAERASREGISLDVATRAEYEESMRQLEESECCGTHEVCEKQQMIRALREKIEYFNDEELDDYAGTPEDEYTDNAVEEFREVLYTMQKNEIEDWLKSLELRGVALPIVLKEEACLLIAEGRTERVSAKAE